ncbi:MAG: site-specific DNA-methyltransferase [Sphingomonadales bacterium]|nr:site-specific DNA-methyltransferase [Sphingomonadaceae bacterium]MBS3930787.1 site-specific DNA-methyltransferase [Sphingomonadales bacterium]
MTWRILTGDCIEQMKTLADQSVQTCVTSPPYFGLRDYGTAEWDGGDAECGHTIVKPDHDAKASFAGRVTRGERSACIKCGATRIDQQIGIEPTPDEFVAAVVDVFREVRRVLRDDGTVWLNLGDSYNARQKGSDEGWDKSRLSNPAAVQKAQAASLRPRPPVAGSKPKDLIGIPWLVAFALRAGFATCCGCETEMRADLWPIRNGHRICIDCALAGRREAKVIPTETGWYVRQDIIWHKPNPMPESVEDRCTKAHEYIFLLSKSRRYFYDAEAIKEPANFPDGPGNMDRSKYADAYTAGDERHRTKAGLAEIGALEKRNKRSVWTVSTKPFSGAHFATFPPDLIEPCVLAGSAEGDTVLDPFAGSGTTGMVALRHNRSFIGCELSPEYAELARNRIRDDAPLMNHSTEAVA